MLFGDIPLVGMLKQRMAWHQERQNVLAQNVANADTPGYRARDLREPDFTQALGSAAGGVSMVRTSAAHLGASGGLPDNASDAVKTYEIDPSGASVSLEDEVMRVSQNVMDYQMVSQLYGRGLGMLKTALGRSA